MDVTKVVNEGRNFTYNNYLNTHGQHRFWKEVDHLIEAFDYHKELLRPTIAAQASYHNQANRNCPATAALQQSESSGINIPVQKVPPRMTVYPRNPKYY